MRGSEERIGDRTGVLYGNCVVSVEYKKGIIESVRSELRKELEAIERAAKDAWEGATHEENRPEHNKDMRSTEASYVAIGQSARARELAEALAKLAALRLVAFTESDAIEMGALVTIEASDGASQRVLIVPAGGGVTVGEGAARVRAVTPQAPLGEALVGASVGDEVTVAAKRYEIVAVE